jgi:hypothetical protein
MDFVIPKRGADNERACVGFVPDMLFKAPRYASLEYMSPRAFLKLADPSFSPKNARKSDFRRRSIRFIVQTIRDGGCFAPLELWPATPRSHGIKHEGRHRAWVAARLGIEEVPVYVWHA